MSRAAPIWYELLWRCLLPFAWLRLWWRGIAEPGYRRNIAERFGRYPPRSDDRPTIWIHAVSVGETRAAQPLITQLARDFPGHQIVLTAMTAAGRATSESLYGDSVARVWLPYDTSTGAERFLDWCRPTFGMLMETELWPNLVLRASARGIPMFLANARMSARSAKGYSRFPILTRNVFRALRGIAAQSAGDAERLTRLGAENIRVTGNVKFDVEVPPGTIEKGRALRALFGSARKIWVAGSTREGEEVLLLDALQRSPLPADALVVIVPRHPQRFDEVAKLLGRRGLRHVRRSDGQTVTDDITFVVGDSMGEMLAYYAAADVAFIGGSLLPLGGQNLIEPLAVGTPVVIGPSTFNFSEVAREAAACDAALQCADADAVVKCVSILLEDPNRRSLMSGNAAALLDAHRGATTRTVAWIVERMRGP